MVIFITQLTPADQAVNSYRIHDPATEKLQERPEGDFEIGLKIFPDLSGAAGAGRRSATISRSPTRSASPSVSVVIVPEEMDRPALDSLARALELVRRDSTRAHRSRSAIRGKLCPASRAAPSTTRAACETIERVVRRLRPDILLPAEDPYDSGTRAAGQLAPQYWESYLTRASAIAKRVRPRTRIGVSASAYDSRDSTLYAWAAARGSPVDVVGLHALPVAHGRAHARRRNARRRSLDARVQLVEGPLGVRRRRLSRKRTARRARSAPSGPRSRGRRADRRSRA